MSINPWMWIAPLLIDSNLTQFYGGQLDVSGQLRRLILSGVVNGAPNY